MSYRCYPHTMCVHIIQHQNAQGQKLYEDMMRKQGPLVTYGICITFISIILRMIIAFNFFIITIILLLFCQQNQIASKIKYRRLFSPIREVPCLLYHTYCNRIVPCSQSTVIHFDNITTRHHEATKEKNK